MIETKILSHLSRLERASDSLGSCAKSIPLSSKCPPIEIGIIKEALKDINFLTIYAYKKLLDAHLASYGAYFLGKKKKRTSLILSRIQNVNYHHHCQFLVLEINADRGYIKGPP